MATFTVTTLTDSGAGSLRQAVSEANAAPGRDTVVFDPGLAGDTLRLTSGEIEITDALVIDGALSGGGVLTLTGDAMGDDITLPGALTDVEASLSADRLADNTRLFNVTEASAELTLENLVLTGGRVNASNDSAADITANGGAVRSLANLSLSDVTVAGNSILAVETNLVGGDGGGLFSAQGLNLTRTTLSGNVADGLGGGAFATGRSSIVDSLIDRNTASESGGGVFINSGEIRNTTVTGNSAVGEFGRAGGIAASGPLRLVDSTISGNRSDNGGGGVLVFYGGAEISTTEVIRSTISDNVTSDFGGGLLIGGYAVLIDSTVSNNSVVAGGNSFSGGGGGLAVTRLLTLERSTLSGNRVEQEGREDGRGGGALTDYGILAINSTIVDNSADFGGGLASRLDDIELRNTTVTGNRAVGENAVGGGLLNFQGDVILTNSLVLGNEAQGAAPGEAEIGFVQFGQLGPGTVVAGQGTSLVGADQNAFDASGFATLFNADPAAVFATGLPADNGGPVATVLLRNDPANPALDAAPAATAPDRDARGLPRPIDLAGVPNTGLADLGALELQGPNVAFVSGTGQGESLGGSALDDLQEGRGGNDTLNASPGADTLNGGAGTDTARYTDAPSAAALNLTNSARNAGSATGDVTSSIELVLGSAFGDTLTGSPQDDRLDGGPGDDALSGGQGDDVLRAGEGADLLRGEEGADSLFGRAGADTLEGGPGADLLDGGGGTDTASYADAFHAVAVNLVNPARNEGAAAGDTYLSIEAVRGSAFDDSLTGSAAGDLLEGG
ncbi:MAG: calcium-binding protein, partial [Pseudomonadota bacterium]